MDCQKCAGACCSDVMIPTQHVYTPDADTARWLRLHAVAVDTIAGEQLRFEARCTALTPEGACGIYEDRPTVCREFMRSSSDCLDAVRRRRTPEQYQAIRESIDPETIH